MSVETKGLGKELALKSESVSGRSMATAFPYMVLACIEAHEKGLTAEQYHKEVLEGE